MERETKRIDVIHTTRLPGRRATVPPGQTADCPPTSAPDTDIASTAVQAAHDAPALRADKIAAARKALADGTLGADAGALADALIDHLIADSRR